MKIQTQAQFFAAIFVAIGSVVSGARAQEGAVQYYAAPPDRAWRPAILVEPGARGLRLVSQPIAPSNSSTSGSRGEAASQSSSTEAGSKLGQTLSNSIVPFGIASGVFLLFDGRHHRGQTRGAIEGIGATAVATEILKYVIPEKRPRGGMHSFPSGHTSFAFALATAVGENHRGARLPLYALATAIGASRVDVRAHYVHDVIAGAALGYFTTKYFMRRNRPEVSSASNSPAAAAPTSSALILEPNGLSLSSGGVSFARSF